MMLFVLPIFLSFEENRRKLLKVAVLLFTFDPHKLVLMPLNGRLQLSVRAVRFQRFSFGESELAVLLIVESVS